MKSDKTLYIAREESFEIESPEVFVTTMTSTVTISESPDGSQNPFQIKESFGRGRVG